MAFFNQILGLNLDEKKTVEVVSTYDWRYGIVLFEGRTWGEFANENAVDYLKDYEIVSQMKEDSGFLESDLIYLLVNWEGALYELMNLPAASTLDEYDSNSYSEEENIVDFYNNLSPQLQQDLITILKSGFNIKKLKFKDLR